MLEEHGLTSVVTIRVHLFFPLLAIFWGGRWEGLRIEVPVVCHSPILKYASSLSRVQWWMSGIPPLPAQRVVCSPETGKNQTLCSPTALMVRWSTALLADGQLPQPLQLPTRLTEALLSHLPGQRPLTSSFYQHGGAQFWPHVDILFTQPHSIQLIIVPSRSVG